MTDYLYDNKHAGKGENKGEENGTRREKQITLIYTRASLKYSTPSRNFTNAHSYMRILRYKVNRVSFSLRIEEISKHISTQKYKIYL